MIDKIDLLWNNSVIPFDYHDAMLHARQVLVGLQGEVTLTLVSVRFSGWGVIANQPHL